MPPSDSALEDRPVQPGMLAAILGALPCPVFFAVRDAAQSWRVLSATPALCHYFGLTEASLPAPLAQLIDTAAEQRRVEAMFNHFWDAPAASLAMEFRTKRPDGTAESCKLEVNRLATLEPPGLLISLQPRVCEVAPDGAGPHMPFELQAAALRSTDRAIMITDRVGLIEWVNPAFTKLTGYTAAEATGQPARMLQSGLHDQEFFRRMWNTILAGSTWNGEIQNRRKDGSIYQEEMTITSVRDESGVATHFIAVKQDISEKKQIEKQLLRAQRMESIGMLAGGIAHDLNNVLAPITMGIELLRLRPGEKESRHVLSTLESSARRGAEIIRQILTFARGVETKRMLLQPRHLIKDMVRMAQETFPRNISVRTDLANDCWPIDGDPTQIHQILLNLSVNARDVLTNGGQIKFTCRNVTLEHPMFSFGLSIPAGQYVVLGVEDNGPGITQEVYEHLFEPFFTTKEPGKGTGLGLSTTFGIAKGHNGLIEVITKPRHGTRFDVYFPATTAESKPSEFSGQDLSPTPRGRGETILVVDDEADIRTVTKALLETYGYQVLLAEDGVEGIALYAQKKDEIALVLTDIMMPFMDGVALVRSLRKLNPTARVIGASGLLSENAAVSRRQTLIELGVTIILKKPFAAEELLGAIKAALT